MLGVFEINVAADLNHLKCAMWSFPANKQKLYSLSVFVFLFFYE